MKRLAKRSQKPSRVIFPQDDSTEALRQRLSKANRWLRTKKRLTAPKFLKELQEKEDFYYFNLSQFDSEPGERFNEEIVRDPIFKAIRYCRERVRQAELRKELEAIVALEFSDREAKKRVEVWKRFLADPPSDWTKPYDPEHKALLSREFVTAVEQGNIPRLKELVQLCEIQETTSFNRPRERQCDSRRLHYYVALAAREFLEKGRLPNKKQVEERALVTQLGDEFPYTLLSPKRWADEWKERFDLLSRPSQRTWTRIFQALGLSDLPSAPTHSR